MSAIRWLWKGPAWVASRLLIGGVRAYQRFGRPLLPPMCRFEPGCSEYMAQAVTKYGPVRGVAKGTWRLCRCHPWSRGGYDPP